MTTQSKAPVEDRIAEIKQQVQYAIARLRHYPNDLLPEMREQVATIIESVRDELTASQSRERALTEERDGLRKQVYDLTGIVSDKNDKIAALTSENKALKEALVWAEHWFDHHIQRDQIPGIAEAASTFRAKVAALTTMEKSG